MSEDYVRYLYKGIRYLWKRAKAEKVERERGIAIKDVAKAYDDEDSLSVENERYPEQGKFVGASHRGIITAAHVKVIDEGTLEIVTAWPASRKEYEKYRAQFGKPSLGPRRSRRGAKRDPSKRISFREFLRLHPPGRSRSRPRSTGRQRHLKNLHRPKALESASRRKTSGTRIQAYRRAWGWTQTFLAEQSGLDQSTISALENDRIPLGPRRSVKISKVFNIDPGILMWGDQRISLSAGPQVR